MVGYARSRSAPRWPAGAPEEDATRITAETQFPLDQHMGGLFLPRWLGRQIRHPWFFINHLITPNVGFHVVIVMNVKNAGRPGLLCPIIECCFQNQPIGNIRGYDRCGLKGFILHQKYSLTRESFRGAPRGIPHPLPQSLSAYADPYCSILFIGEGGENLS